jgi:ketosteroid isomerase-like protein
MRLVSLCAAIVACLVFSLPLRAAGTGAAWVDAAWVKAMQANDVDAVMKLYALNAVAWFPNTPEAKGAQAIRATYEGLLGANTVKEVVLSETGYKTTGNQSTGWGKFKLTLVPKAGGEANVMTGRYTGMAEKRGGKWVYVVDHASADPAK